MNKGEKQYYYCENPIYTAFSHALITLKVNFKLVQRR